jgi:hypothetical protein
MKYLFYRNTSYYQQLTYISDQNGFFYDGRIQTPDSFLNYLIAKVNTLSSFLVLLSGSSLTVLNQQQSEQLVRKSDLFTVYFKNDLMTIFPSDLSGISSVINQAWVLLPNRMIFIISFLIFLYNLLFFLLKKLYHRLNQRLWSHMVIKNTLMQSTL